jgi:hypothetical protein
LPALFFDADTLPLFFGAFLTLALVAGGGCSPLACANARNAVAPTTEQV